jgi:heme/copper-type cytochrome/quinol oxidase subunit 2
MLDPIFWAVVALVLWFAWDTRQHMKKQQEIENTNNLEMETIYGLESQDELG